MTGLANSLPSVPLLFQHLMCGIGLNSILDMQVLELRMNALSKTVLCVVFVLGHASIVCAQVADTIYHNGSILTMAGTEPNYVEAIAVKDGKIALAGGKADALKMKGDATKVVDLGGKALLPGFLDAHSHYINSLLVANQCKLYAPPSGVGKDVPSIIAELKKYAEDRSIPKGEMIMGYGYDDTVMPDGRLLNRDDLDEAFPDNPVRIDHVSMHGAVMNSLALKKYGISAATKTPAGGVIVRKPGTEEPYGLIMETAFLPVMAQVRANDREAGSGVESRGPDALRGSRRHHRPRGSDASPPIPDHQARECGRG